MANQLSAQVSININATADEVWHALTTPSVIKQWLFGADVNTDWKVGSPIDYTGEFNGKSYHDKGTILKFEPGKVLESTYWSSMGKREDKPENYYKVTYALTTEADITKLTISQDNIATDEEREHTTKNWQMVTAKIKEMVEAG